MARKHIPKSIETAVFLKSRRKCALCFHLNDDQREKRGQIAHLDQDPSNFVEDNLAYLCIDHHSVYDSTTSQHKNYTLHEVKAWREMLYFKVLEMERASLLSLLNDQKATPRERDVKILDSVLRKIHWPTIDEHIAQLPCVMVFNIFHFWEDFNGELTATLFHLNDAELESEFREVHRWWGETVSYGIHYEAISNGNFLFVMPHDSAPGDKHDRDWKRIQTGARRLKSAKTELLERIRRDYSEINLVELSRYAWAKYVDYLNQDLV